MSAFVISRFYCIIINQDLMRLDHFNGFNFTRWQDKVKFLLMTLKIFYILDPTFAPLPKPKKNKISPYELCKGRKPNIGYFKVWGCLAYYKKMNPNKTKFGLRVTKCAFVDYASNRKAYRR